MRYGVKIGLTLLLPHRARASVDFTGFVVSGHRLDNNLAWFSIHAPGLAFTGYC